MSLTRPPIYGHAPQYQEYILGWSAYPVPRLDQKVLSPLTDDDVIAGLLFSLASGLPTLGHREHGTC